MNFIDEVEQGSTGSKREGLTLSGNRLLQKKVESPVPPTRSRIQFAPGSKCSNTQLNDDGVECMKALLKERVASIENSPDRRRRGDRGDGDDSNRFRWAKVNPSVPKQPAVGLEESCGPVGLCIDAAAVGHLQVNFSGSMPAGRISPTIASPRAAHTGSAATSPKRREADLPRPGKQPGSPQPITSGDVDTIYVDSGPESPELIMIERQDSSILRQRALSEASTNKAVRKLSSSPQVAVGNFNIVGKSTEDKDADSPVGFLAFVKPSLERRHLSRSKSTEFVETGSLEAITSKSPKSNRRWRLKSDEQSDEVSMEERLTRKKEAKLLLLSADLNLNLHREPPQRTAVPKISTSHKSPPERRRPDLELASKSPSSRRRFEVEANLKRKPKKSRGKAISPEDERREAKKSLKKSKGSLSHIVETTQSIMPVFPPSIPYMAENVSNLRLTGVKQIETKFFFKEPEAPVLQMLVSVESLRKAMSSPIDIDIFLPAFRYCTMEVEDNIFTCLPQAVQEAAMPQEEVYVQFMRAIAVMTNKKYAKIKAAVDVVKHLVEVVKLPQEALVLYLSFVKPNSPVPSPTVFVLNRMYLLNMCISKYPVLFWH